MATTTSLLQLLSISTALLASGGIAASSLFDIPMLSSLPASRSLPLIRWYFSRGSHVFPTAAILSSTCFAYLSYVFLPPSTTTTSFSLPSLFHHLTTSSSSSSSSQSPSPYYALASLLTLSIAPWTTLVMIPTNFRLIEMNEKLGGKISAGQPDSATGRSAEGSVNNEGGKSQWTDLSGPQGGTGRESSREEDEEVRGLLGRFQRLNWVRAGLIGAGGMVGVVGVMRA